FFGDIFRNYDRRAGRHEPIDIIYTRVGGSEHAHRCAFEKSAHCAGCSHTNADIGAARYDRLDCLARTLRAEVLQHDAMLLKYPGVHAESRHLVRPSIDLPNGKF